MENEKVFLPRSILELGIPIPAIGTQRAPLLLGSK